MVRKKQCPLSKNVIKIMKGIKFMTLLLYYDFEKMAKLQFNKNKML